MYLEESDEEQQHPPVKVWQGANQRQSVSLVLTVVNTVLTGTELRYAKKPSQIHPVGE